MAVKSKPALPVRPRRGKIYAIPASASGAPAVPMRVLVTVTVVGSAGPLRFLVDEGAPVSVVIDTTLKSYARARRHPVLGTRASDFLLYYSHGRSDALSPTDTVTFNGYRSFILFHREGEAVIEAPEDVPTASGCARKKIGGWKAGLNKLLTFKM